MKYLSLALAGLMFAPIARTWAAVGPADDTNRTNSLSKAAQLSDTNASAIPLTNGVAPSEITSTNLPEATATNGLRAKGTNAVSSVWPSGVTNAAAPPASPAAAVATFRLPPGLKIEQVAAEPMVQSPVAGAFDEFGRLYVVEMIGYPTQRSARLGRIRLLEDTNEDGCFDKATTFAEGLPWPSGIACANGGVFVGATPDLWFMKDNDGDGIADEKRVVLTGFASDYAPYDAVKLDVQSLLNNFKWGLDNRIHGDTSYDGGTIPAQGGVLDLLGRDFQFDPRELIVGSEAGGEQSGLSFDSTGHKFVCSLRDELQAVVYDDRYAARNPYFAMPTARLSISASGPAARLFRLTPGPGYSAMASGVLIYGGTALPKEYLGDAFVGDLAANVVHREKIFWPNIVPVARRASPNERTEFLASTDPWFRPVQLLNGPDGALYVIDMHRGVIVHPWSLDESQAKEVDWNLGRNQGRIYRIAPDDFEQPALDKLGYATVEDLVATLDSPDAWHRETAARLLLERHVARSVPLIEKLLETDKSPVGRLQALYTLNGLGALQLPHVLRGLGDPDGRVREQALRLAERFIPTNGPPAAGLSRAFNVLTADPAARVRFQLALTLGQLPVSLRVAPLAALVRRDLGNPWILAAVLNSLAEGADRMFTGFVSMPAMTRSVPGQQFLMNLATLVGTRNSTGEVARVFSAALSLKDKSAKLALVRALNDGLERAGTTWHSIGTETNTFAFRTMLSGVLSNPTATDAERLQAVPLLAADDYPTAAASLLPLLGGKQAQSLQLAVIHALGRFSGTQVAADLLDRWRLLSLGLRKELAEMILARPERVAVLLSAMERGFIQPAELNSVQLQRLLSYPDPTIRRRAEAVIRRTVNPNRSQVLASYAIALKTRGSSVRGHSIFRNRCAGCHQLGGEGGNYGPPLSGIRGAGRQWLLTNILAPNRYVAPAYFKYRVTMKTGEMLEGLLDDENAASVRLRRPGSTDLTLLRRDIQSIDNLGVSLMPEGLEWGLTQLDMADLLDYILTAP